MHRPLRSPQLCISIASANAALVTMDVLQAGSAHTSEPGTPFAERSGDWTTTTVVLLASTPQLRATPVSSKIHIIQKESPPLTYLQHSFQPVICNWMPCAPLHSNSYFSQTTHTDLILWVYVRQWSESVNASKTFYQLYFRKCCKFVRHTSRTPAVRSVLMHATVSFIHCTPLSTLILYRCNAILVRVIVASMYICVQICTHPHTFVKFNSISY